VFKTITGGICCSGCLAAFKMGFPLIRFASNWLYQVLKVQG
jgi:hypothetical protein